MKCALFLILAVWQILPSVQEDAECSELRNTFTVVPDVAVFRWTVNKNTVDPAKSTLTAEYTYSFPGWTGIAIAQNAGMMVGAEAVIGLPDEPNSATNPGKYLLGAQNIAGVQLMAAEKQTLIDASITQDENNVTVLKFTKYLEEDGEITIDPAGPNNLLGAGGMSNTLAAHAPQARGGFTLDFTPDCVDGKLGGGDKDPMSGSESYGFLAAFWLAIGTYYLHSAV